MIVHRSARRSLGVLALAVPLAVGVLAATAPAALASGGSIAVSPAPDSSTAEITSGTSVTVTGTITTGTNSTRLDLSGPGSYAGNTTINQCPNSVLNPCKTQSKSLTVDLTSNNVPRPNGKWTATLSGGTPGSKVFYTNFAPTSTPSGLTATGTGASRVDLSWTYTGNEPDLAGFRIADDQGNTDTVDTSACNGSSCSATRYYDNPDPGTYTYSFTVTALRTSGGCADCGTYTESSPSSSASAQLVTPQPPPSPTPAPSGSPAAGGGTGSTTGSTGGSATSGSTGKGGSTGGARGSSTTGSGAHGTSGSAISIPSLSPIVAQRRSFALSFNHFSPSLGIPKLPPLPATTFPVTAPTEDNGNYQPTLPYTAQRKTTTTTVFSNPIAAFSTVDPTILARCLAVALIMLVCAGHVRLFLSAHKSD